MPLSLRALTVLAAVFVSILPPQLRRWWPYEESSEFKTGALLSGLFQSVFCLVLHLFRYFAYFNRTMPVMTLETAQTMATTTFGTVLGYFFLPSSIVILYFAIEGGVRMFSAFVAQEPIGTLPLHLFFLIRDRVSRLLYRLNLPPLVADTVESGRGTAYDLRVLSCRPKAWDRWTIIGYQDTFYSLIRAEQGPPELPFTYVLKKAPPWRLVVKPYRYDPQEVLIAAGLKKTPAGSPGGNAG